MTNRQELDTLLAELGHDDWQVRHDVALKLAKLGRLAVPPLIQAVKNTSLPVEHRKSAAFALGEIGDERAVDVFTEIAMGYWKSFEIREQVRVSQGLTEDAHLGLAREVKDALKKMGYELRFEQLGRPGMSKNKQEAIDEVGRAVESINADSHLAAIEHAEKAMKLDPSVTGAFDMMGIACLKLANYFRGTPDSKKYEQRSLAAFKQAARMGSKSAIGQLAHLGIKWEYPECTACGEYADPATDIKVRVTCKCGVRVSIDRSSVNKNSGATVVHDNLAAAPSDHDTRRQRCKYTTYVPPNVWCPECGLNFVSEWQTLVISGTEAEVEKARWQHHPIATQYRKMASDLVSQYGPLTRVEYLSHYPDFEINFVFKSKTVHSGKRRGQHDIHFLSMGYVGEGPRYCHCFLAAAGYELSSETIESIKPGATIERRDGQTRVFYRNQEVPEEPSLPSPGDANYRSAVELAHLGNWHKAFIELREAVNRSHPDAKKLVLRNVWCPHCRSHIGEPSTSELRDYGKFWSGMCPGCESQLRFETPSGA